MIRKDPRHGWRESFRIMKAGAGPGRPGAGQGRRTAAAGPSAAGLAWPAGPPWPQPAAVSSISSASPRVRLGSTWIPGLMVLVRMIFLR